MIGARCKLLVSGFHGLVVGKRTYLGEADRYAVRYIDDAGPQERWFQAGEITFDGSEAEGAYGTGNVVALDGARAAAAGRRM